MWQSSLAFDSAIKKSHTVISKFEFYYNPWGISTRLLGQSPPDGWSDGTAPMLVYSSDLDDKANAIITSGTVTLRKSAAVRATFNFEMIIKDKNVYNKYIDPSLQLGIVPYRGIILPDGTKEYIPLGVFQIDTSRVEMLGNAIKLTATAYDKAFRLDRPSNVPVPGAALSGSSVTTAILGLGGVDTQYLPNWGMVIGTNTQSVPATTFSGGSYWSYARKLSEAIGFETYHNRLGVQVVQQIIDPNLRPVDFDFSSGTVNTRVGPIIRTMALNSVINQVVCNASAPWLLFPVSGSFQDTDITSPTYVYGPIGIKTKIISDPIASSNAQCTAIAQAEFFRNKGIIESLEFTAIPDPRMDVGDIIRVVDDVFKQSTKYVIDSLTIPLLGGTISGNAKMFSKGAVL